LQTNILKVINGLSRGFPIESQTNMLRYTHVVTRSSQPGHVMVELNLSRFSDAFLDRLLDWQRTYSRDESYKAEAVHPLSPCGSVSSKVSLSSETNSAPTKRTRWQ